MTKMSVIGLVICTCGSVVFAENAPEGFAGKYIHAAVVTSSATAPSQGIFPLCETIPLEQVWKSPNHEMKLARELGDGLKLVGGNLKVFYDDLLKAWRLVYFAALADESGPTPNFNTPWGQGFLSIDNAGFAEFGNIVRSRPYRIEFRIDDRPKNLSCE